MKIWLPNHFEILHIAWQWYCHAMCKISKWLGIWETNYGWIRLCKFWVWKDIIYYNRSWVSFGCLAYLCHRGRHWSSLHNDSQHHVNPLVLRQGYFTGDWSISWLLMPWLFAYIISSHYIISLGTCAWLYLDPCCCSLDGSLLYVSCIFATGDSSANPYYIMVGDIMLIWVNNKAADWWRTNVTARLLSAISLV